MRTKSTTTTATTNILQQVFLFKSNHDGPDQNLASQPDLFFNSSLFCFLQPQIATSSKNELYDPITTPKTISLAVMMTDDTVM